MLALLSSACDSKPLAPEIVSLELTPHWTTTPTLELGVPLPAPPRVRVSDANGRSRAGVEVSFVVIRGGGLVRERTVTTDANGEAAADWTLGLREEPQTLIAYFASVTNGASATFSTNVSGGPAAHLLFDVPTARLPYGTSAPTQVSFQNAAGRSVDAPGPITYSSADEGVVTISATGLVTATGAGYTWIRAESGGLVTSELVRAYGPPATIELLVLSRITSGKTAPTEVIARDAGGETVEAPGPTTYRSADEAIATISASGLVTGVAFGRTWLYATSGLLQDSTLAEVREGLMGTAFSAGVGFGLAFTPNQMLVLSQSAGGSLRRFDVALGVQMSGIVLSRTTLDVATRPDGARALAVPASEFNELYEVDLIAAAHIRTVPLPLRPLRVLYGADGSTAYVTTQTAVLLRVDLATLAVQSLSLAGAGELRGLAMSPDGSLLAVSSAGGIVHLVSTETFAMTRSAWGFDSPESVAFSADGASIFVTSTQRALKRISTSSLVVQATAGPGGHTDVRATPDGKYLFATRPFTDELHLFLAETLEFLTSYSIIKPARIAVDPVTGFAWVSNSANPSVVRLVIF